MIASLYLKRDVNWNYVKIDELVIYFPQKCCSCGFCIFTRSFSCVSCFFIFHILPRTPTVGAIIEFPGSPSSPSGLLGPGSPYPKRKKKKANPYPLFSVLIYKVLQKKRSIQLFLTVTIIELGNMKSVFLKEAFTT